MLGAKCSGGDKARAGDREGTGRGGAVLSAVEYRASGRAHCLWFERRRGGGEGETQANVWGRRRAKERNRGGGHVCHVQGAASRRGRGRNARCPVELDWFRVRARGIPALGIRPR